MSARLCRWCHQPYNLGTRRYMRDYCCVGHYVADVQEPIKATIVVAGGDGQTLCVEAKVREWPAPVCAPVD